MLLESKRHLKITLEIDEEEAEMLMNLLGRPAYKGELDESVDFRQRLYNSLDSHLVRGK